MKKVKINNVEKKSSSGMLGFFSFIAMIITAVLLFFNNMMPIFDLSESITNTLTTIKDCLILFIIGLNSWRFVKNKGNFFKALFVVVLIIFIVSISFVWIF